MITNANRVHKTVADPIPEYESMISLWERSRAVISGERFVKELDELIDVRNYSNLLIPFSPNMSQAQYNFYRAEAELPGITSQYAKMLVGALLRKKPVIEFNIEGLEPVKSWVYEEFAQDNSTLISFLTEALKEELQTSRAWVYVDFPTMTEADLEMYSETAKPYPVLWKAESVISWKTAIGKDGVKKLTRIITKEYFEDYSKNEFHPEIRERVRVHDLDEQGLYRIRVYESESPNPSKVIAGKVQANTSEAKDTFILVDSPQYLVNGSRIDFIPAWPLNGSVEPEEPHLSSLIDREIALYNKISRRNHLLYGAATYTPWVASDMDDEQFEDIVASGLGTWLHLRAGDTIGVLETPTQALADMDRAIAAHYEEMAKMGIRMLSPETAQSGVALELRNASQTAQLGSLNIRISDTMKQIILFMINWRYGLSLDSSAINFSMSSDLHSTPLGADWLRLATEWYQQGLIPRSVWLSLLKANELLEAEYDDLAGMQEIAEDVALMQEAIEKQSAIDGE